MTEREKMLAGMIYNSRDEELLNMYHTSKKLLSEFNSTPPTEWVVHDQRSDPSKVAFVIVWHLKKVVI